MFRNHLIVILLAIAAVSCKSPEARRPIKSSSGTFIQQSAERNKKLLSQEEAIIQNIMDADTSKTFLASDSGFWYYYNIVDTTTVAYPKLGDAVTFTYNIKKLDGALILSEKENGLQNYQIDKSNQELISGIRDGLKLMRVGETVTFLFPSYKAYGYYGIEEKLGTNVAVQSTVSLKTIQTPEN